ncbi:MAG: bile acid:sodium symporter family protein [Deltaproteobacteria bacterium]|nr:MAG: bile acid:sodium symporter family protein [Deltaproteobacteria bacterium]
MESSLASQLFLPAALFLIMLGLGLSLMVEDFRRVIVQPRGALLGLGVQLVLLPVVGFVIARTFPMSPELAMGIMVLAACPGGATSNLITWLARGDAALSVTLTAVSSVISVVTIPLILGLSMSYFLDGGEIVRPPALQMILQIVVITIVPVSIGMAVRARAPGLAERAGGPMKVISAVLLAVIILALVLRQRDEIVGFFVQSGPAALTLNLVMMSVGFGLAALARLPVRQRISVSIEGGLQNGTLGIAIAAGILGSEVMAIPPAIYSLIMFATGAGAIVVFSRLESR